MDRSCPWNTRPGVVTGFRATARPPSFGKRMSISAKRYQMDSAMRSSPAGLYGPKTCVASRGASDARSARGHLRVAVGRDIAQLGRNGRKLFGENRPHELDYLPRRQNGGRTGTSGDGPPSLNQYGRAVVPYPEADLNGGLVQVPSGKGQIFEVTHRGFSACGRTGRIDPIRSPSAAVTRLSAL